MFKLNLFEMFQLIILSLFFFLLYLYLYQINIFFLVINLLNLHKNFYCILALIVLIGLILYVLILDISKFITIFSTRR